MSTLTASVGKNGINHPDDVRTIQTLLNKNRPLGQSLIAANGLMNAETIAAIEEYQRHVVKLQNPDGVVDPDGKTLKALDASAQQSAATANHSGAAWWHANQAKFPNSNRVEDLEPTFRAKIQEFLVVLSAAGATTTISATLRSKQRFYLMRHSFLIANGSESPSAVPAEPGVNIIWDHGDLGKSMRAAQEMVKLFDIVFEPSLTSLHMTGQAVDMDITWSGTLAIRGKAGQLFHIDAPRNGGDNIVLHAIGATYGVIKLVSDKPHWSANGH